MDGWTIIFILGGVTLLQTVLSYFQMRYYTKEFIELKKIGRVVIGKRPGMLTAGTMVMFAIDPDGIILQAKMIQGVTVFARCKPLNGYSGKAVSSLTAEDCRTENKFLQKAILNAKSNYNIIMGGGELPKSRSFFQKISNFCKQKLAKSKV